MDFFKFCFSYSLFFVVICLTDDDDNSDDNDSKHSISILTPTKQPDILTVANNETYESSNWIIHQDDIIHVPELPSKYSDIYKKPFEIRCKTIRFGVTEFDIESDVILMKRTEFEMKLIGKRYCTYE